MTRALFAAALLFAFVPAANAQDMPLSQILIDGEGWKKVEVNPQEPKRADPRAVTGDSPFLRREPIAAVRSASGDTIFVSHDQTDYILAYPADAKGITGKGARYCPLRTRQGLFPAAESLTVDKDGRIYAGTELGVQVFDPTGRLCGVLTPAERGFHMHLAFEGDQLTCWVGNTKYSRKLSTTGAK